MRLVTYRGTIESAARLGAIENDMVVDVERIGAKAGLSPPAAMRARSLTSGPNATANDDRMTFPARRILGEESLATTREC
jgi:hypothetical protein